MFLTQNSNQETELSLAEQAKCERLKIIRKSFHMTQEQFGEKIGLSGVTKSCISQIERKARKLSDSLVDDICKEFAINREWLETGTGNMEIQITNDEKFAAFLGTILVESEESPRKQTIRLLEKMSPEWYEKFVAVLSDIEARNAGIDCIKTCVELLELLIQPNEKKSHRKKKKCRA